MYRVYNKCNTIAFDIIHVHKLLYKYMLFHGRSVLSTIEVLVPFVFG